MSAPVLPVDAAGSRARIDAGDLRQASRKRALRIEQEARKSCDQLVLAMAVSR
jgi:hypothetical protein